MYNILISEKIDSVCAALFREAGFHVDEKDGLSRQDLEAAIGDYDGLVVRSATQVDAALFKKAEKLKVVGRAGAGVDNIDVAAATNAKVVVMNTPGQNSNAAAELSVGLLFALARRIVPACASLKACRWDKKGLMGAELFGKTLGVIGYGAIGRRVGAMGRGIGMQVLGYDPYLNPDQIRAAGAEPVFLDDLLAQSDFITLHVPKTPETANLINQDTLAKMKPGAYLVNCARGGLVDERALYEALKSRHLAGAALDVFAVEPPGEHFLLELDNFICTPHLGASTAEAQTNVAVAVARQMTAYLKDGALEGAVNA